MKKLISKDNCYFCKGKMVTVKDMGGGYFLTQCLNCGNVTTKHKQRIIAKRYRIIQENRKSKKLREIKERWGY